MQKLKGALCTMAQSAEQDQDTKAPPRRRPVSRLAVAIYTLCWSVLLCFGLLVAIMQDRMLPVPELLRVKLSQVLNANRTLPIVDLAVQSWDLPNCFILNWCCMGSTFRMGKPALGCSLGPWMW